MPNLVFDLQGRYLRGQHRGKHASALPMSYVEWACLNIDGFKEQFGKLSRGEPLKPTPTPKAFSQDRPVRRYFLSRTRRHYEPDTTEPT